MDVKLQLAGLLNRINKVILNCLLVDLQFIAEV